MLEPRLGARSLAPWSGGLFLLLSLSPPVQWMRKRWLYDPDAVFLLWTMPKSPLLVRKTRIWFPAPPCVVLGSWTSHLTSLKLTLLISKMDITRANIYSTLTCARHCSKYIIWVMPHNPPTSKGQSMLQVRTSYFHPSTEIGSIRSLCLPHAVSQNGCEN